LVEEFLRRCVNCLWCKTSINKGVFCAKNLWVDPDVFDYLTYTPEDFDCEDFNSMD